LVRLWRKRNKGKSWIKVLWRFNNDPKCTCGRRGKYECCGRRQPRVWKCVRSKYVVWCSLNINMVNKIAEHDHGQPRNSTHGWARFSCAMVLWSSRGGVVAKRITFSFSSSLWIGPAYSVTTH
jgi:hypothetical protein